MAGRKKKEGRSGAAVVAGRRRGAASPSERRRTIAEMRAFAHPIRLRLYELFAESPRTTMQVAAILGEPPTRLYHHVNALQRSGLLRLKETRPIRGAVEKYFEAVRPKRISAEGILASPAARQSARAAAATVFEQARQDLFAELRDLSPKGPAAPMVLRMLLWATPARAAAIRKRLFEMVKGLKDVCRDEREAKGSSKRPASEERWSLTLAFARAWPPRGNEEEA